MIFQIRGQDCGIRGRKERENRITKRAALFLIERPRRTAERTKSLVSPLMLRSLPLGFNSNHECLNVARSFPK